MSASAPPKTKIFVGRLPETCRSEELRVLFEKYGTVTECDVLNRYGFVHMSTPEEAEDAIRGLNEIEFQGSRISVEPSTGKRSGRGGRGGGGGGSMRGPIRIERGPPVHRGLPPAGVSVVRASPYDRRDTVPVVRPVRSAYDYEDYYARVAASREYYENYRRLAAESYSRAAAAAAVDDRRITVVREYPYPTASYYPRTAATAAPSAAAYSRYPASSSSYPSAYSAYPGYSTSSSASRPAAGSSSPY